MHENKTKNNDNNKKNNKQKTTTTAGLAPASLSLSKLIRLLLKSRIFSFRSILACRGSQKLHFGGAWTSSDKLFIYFISFFVIIICHYFCFELYHSFVLMRPLSGFHTQHWDRNSIIFSVFSQKLCFCFVNGWFLAPRPRRDFSYNLAVSKHDLKRLNNKKGDCFDLDLHVGNFSNTSTKFSTQLDEPFNTNRHLFYSNSFYVLFVCFLNILLLYFIILLLFYDILFYISLFVFYIFYYVILYFTYLFTYVSFFIYFLLINCHHSALEPRIAALPRSDSWLVGHTL